NPETLVAAVCNSISGQSERFCLPMPELSKHTSIPPILVISSSNEKGASSRVTSIVRVHTCPGADNRIFYSSSSLRPATPTCHPAFRLHRAP
ncbi:hypothetical protein NE655_22105, partial [Phocaeicola vulgatus]|nr:hypothetical protein [Phocaeicola vulgatus]